MTKQTRHEGVLLVPEKLRFPRLNKLSGESAKASIENYTEKIKRYNEKAQKTLNAFSYRNNEICGSNPFANVELASENLALPSEIEHAVRLNADYFKDTYEDNAIVLITEGDTYKPNDYIARHVAKQLKKRAVNLPARISLRGSTLKEDNASDYGLVFLLGESTEILHAPEFTHDNNRKRFFKTDERGIPIFDEEGDRYFYTRKDGLSRLYLDWDLGLVSNVGDLADSDEGGRVVLVSGEAAGFDFAQQLEQQQKANFERIRNSITEIYKTKNADLEKKFANAKALLETD